MIEIMSKLNDEYVSSVEKEEVYHIQSINKSLLFKTSQEHRVLFGGDQLTVARARAAQQHVMNSDDDHTKLLGLITVVEDWQKLNLLSVSLICNNYCISCNHILLT